MENTGSDAVGLPAEISIRPAADVPPASGTEISAFRVTLTFSVLVLFAIGVAIAAVTFHGVPATLPSADIIIPKLRPNVAPEPVERFAFMLGSVLVPAAALVLVAMGGTMAVSLSRRGCAALSAALYAMIAALILIGFSEFDFGLSTLKGKAALDQRSLPILLGCVGLAAAWTFAWVGAGRKQRLPRPAPASLAAATWGPFIVALATQVSWRVVGETSMQPAIAWSIHMDAVTYAIAQVISGRTILVDLPSQYGFAAEFLGNLFRMIGFSVLKMTSLFALMQIFALAALFQVILKHTLHLVLQLAFALALVMVTFETVIRINDVAEFYFQYWPLRFLWPALSVLAFHFYRLRPTLGRAATVSLIGAVGSIWNADSGLVIAGAFTAFLAVKWLCLLGHAGTTAPRRHLIRAAALHAAIFLGVLGVTALYILVKGDHAPHWEWLTAYQQLFYGLGLQMLPLPLGVSNPWMTVLGVYLLGIVTAAIAGQRAATSRTMDLVFYLSVLGWGLFVYYQGRSHILNLITVCWPALMIGTILADRAIRFVRSGRLGRPHLILPSVALGLLLYCAVPFVTHAGALWAGAGDAFASRGAAVSPLVADELAFIRSYSTPGQECVILSLRQGLYYAATGLSAPVEGPGYIELLTVRDQDALIQQLTSHRFACVFVGLGPQSAVTLGTDVLGLFPGYDTVATSPLGSMIALRPSAQ
ncbi:hypothetical protein [Azospirillum sp. B4]|uniref:hypothetical protein n=1 Tax=Azospirillum sp. B4 TaxID=95605 RepID=UPI00034AD66A|nr:hypothetical protein [Azospirillum sp. B4]